MTMGPQQILLRNDSSNSSVSSSSSSSDNDDNDDFQLLGGDDGESSCCDTNSQRTGSGGSINSSDHNNMKKDRFTSKESRNVFVLKLIVLFVLLIAGIAVCIVVYYISDKNDTDNMDTQFNAAAERILESFRSIVTEKLGMAGSFVVTVVAEGEAMDDKWPFVSLASFQERAKTVKDLSGALYIGINPIVKDEIRDIWEDYTRNSQDSEWYQDGLIYQKALGLDVLDNVQPQISTTDPNLDVSNGIANHIYDYDINTRLGIVTPKDVQYLPIWQTSPVTTRSIVNQNSASDTQPANICLQENSVVFDGMQFSPPGYADDINPNTSEIAFLLSMKNKKQTKYEGDIYTNIYFPLFNNLSSSYNNNRTTVGVMKIVILWAKYFENILMNDKDGVIIVLENGAGCDDNSYYTYQLHGNTVECMGYGDLHDKSYDKYVRTVSLFDGITTISDGTSTGLPLYNDDNNCYNSYKIRVYPSDNFIEQYEKKTPAIITFAVALVFVFTIIMFFCYDRLVSRRQKILLEKANRTHKIVSTLFPKHIRDKIMDTPLQTEPTKSSGILGTKQSLKSFVADGVDDDGKNNGGGKSTIADLYPEATVLFADIAGFTAWSSSREPAQVFILLQNVYEAFDLIAQRRHVLKVETIGDSYVAVTGLPDPQPQHAVIMARFALECMAKMRDIALDLETTLGPDTSDLSIRCGIHSGPVTAGVLRGDRSRFQLFGDTVNTASRMESTGKAGKIQCSSTTAEILVKSGKAHWITPREDDLEAKGKGVISTCWVNPHSKQRSGSNASCSTAGYYSDMTGLDILEEEEALVQNAKQDRLVDWVTEVFKDCMTKIAVRNMTVSRKASLSNEIKAGIPLDEVVDTISLPAFNRKLAQMVSAAGSIEIPDEIVPLLHDYVTMVKNGYNDNPFHNFEHACHVLMNTVKFLNRIVTPEIDMQKIEKDSDKSTVSLEDDVLSHLHAYTLGLNSDPITFFAILFSTLIHDVDHRGISNVQLGKENPDMAKRYRDKSLAEQNSLEIAWKWFMDDKFQPLRQFLFCNPEDQDRFRQVVFNVVLATDIFDKDLNDIRKARWAKAFAPDVQLSRAVNDLRATIVMEHIMQASDVCHTMQHWRVYRKFNARLFHELRNAYKTGRMGADPATFWYKGEIGFFDNYIIPLAKKLKDCNVFGVSSDECLNYALQNRAEWEVRGEGIVKQLVEDFPLLVDE